MRLRTSIAALALSVGALTVPAAPANAGPYCGDIDVVWCAVLYVIEKADCKINKNC